MSKSASYPPAERLAWAVRFCENAQIRLTPARVKILACLARHRSPVNLETISLAEGIRGCWDATTVYRTLMLLKGLEVVRQVSVRHKVRYFVLNVPGEVCDYLICRCCGSIAELPLLQTVVDLEQKVRRTQGYTAVYHELEIYGICPQCQSAGKWSWPSSKLPVRT